jgi:hypothetical protein
MSEQMTPLRRRVLDDMALRNAATTDSASLRAGEELQSLLSAFTRQTDFRGRSNLAALLKNTPPGA